ncbi:MAG: anthranilate synthase component I, partial [Chloroflexi bacterium]|nr:anthranilate synthase component I [Chloroflexota bacterium]
MTSATASITTPSLDEVRALAASGEGNIVPIYREVRADLETPVSAYLKVARGPYSFLLESVEGGEQVGRYSFIGTEPYRVEALAHEDGDPLLVIEEELGRYQSIPVPGLPLFHGGAVGYLGYESVAHFERLPTVEHDDLGLPETWLMFADTLLVFDHVRNDIKVVSHVRLDRDDLEAEYARAAERIEMLVHRLEAPLAALPYVTLDGPVGRSVESNWPREDYLLAVERTKQYIVDGDIIQAVISQRFGRETGAHPFEVYRSLRAINPSPYMYYLQYDDLTLVGASPELLVKVEDGKVDVHPIAGTRPRTGDAEEDARLAEDLETDPKEIAE